MTICHQCWYFLYHSMIRWIAERYDTSLWTSVCSTMPWAVSLQFSDNKLFIGPKHNMYTFFMILFDLFDTIQFYYLSAKSIICQPNLSCELWKQKIENKQILFLKNSTTRLFSKFSTHVFDDDIDRVALLWWRWTRVRARVVDPGMVDR